MSQRRHQNEEPHCCELNKSWKSLLTHMSSLSARPAENSSTPVPATTLRGHKDDVLSLSHSISGNSLLSASADNTVRHWDLRTSKTTRIYLPACFPLDADGVTSVSFSPPGESSSETGSESSTFVASCGDELVTFDLRFGGVVFRSRCDSGISAIRPGGRGEEINCVDTFSSNGYVGCVDDGGLFTLSSPNEGPIQRISLGADTILTSLAFKPKSKGYSGNCAGVVAVGGTDSKLTLFDLDRKVGKGKKFWAEEEREEPVGDDGTTSDKNSADNDTGTGTGTGTGTILGSAYHITQVNFCTPPSASAATSQMCNPPFVNDIKFSKDGRLLAAGLGSGDIALMRVDGNNKLTGWRSSGSSHSRGNGKRGGKKKNLAASFASTPTMITPKSTSRSVSSICLPLWSGRNRYVLNGGSSASIVIHDIDPPGGASSEFEVDNVFSIAEGEKVNDMLACEDGRVLVADTTGEVKIFNMF